MKAAASEMQVQVHTALLDVNQRKIKTENSNFSHLSCAHIQANESTKGHIGKKFMKLGGNHIQTQTYKCTM